MLGVLPDQRRQSRVQLWVSARVSPNYKKAEGRVAFVRDANVLGAFLYCDLKVAVGESVKVELRPLHGNRQLALNCAAKVVRVEESAINRLSGVALEFHDFEVPEPEKTITTTPGAPFIGWTVDMVDKMFTRRPELQTHASRIRGAA